MQAEFSIKKQKTDSFLLTAKGDINVQYAPLLKDNLLKLYSHEGELSVSLQAVESIEVAAIQLLLSFKRVCKQSDRIASIKWPETKPLIDLLDKTGISLVF